ncbi:hypothetical protein [Roseovarius sp. 2305UL8-3]|uniref:hypothetical protein n=1 Tax=Roseovarius conchicola TaxID=3121636 RepID=UPI00352846C5
MTVRVYLESKEVGNTSFGHLYLVLRDDDNPAFEAQVIRGGPSSFSLLSPIPLLEIQTGSLADSADTYTEGTPQGQRFSIDITNEIGGVEVWPDCPSSGILGQMAA